jgi:hypothetical protein
MFRLELLQLQPVLCSLQAKHEAAPKADAEAAEHIRMLVRECLGSLSGSSARRSWACIATGMISTHDADAAIHVATVLGHRVGNCVSAYGNNWLCKGAVLPVHRLTVASAGE